MWKFSHALKYAVHIWATLPCLPYYYNIIVVRNKTTNSFKLLYQTNDCRSFQFLSHFKLLPKLSSNCNRTTFLVESFNSMKTLLHSQHHPACWTLYSSAHYWNSYIQWYHLVFFPLIMPYWYTVQPPVGFSEFSVYFFILLFFVSLSPQHFVFWPSPSIFLP